MHVLLLFYIAEGLFCTIPELLNLRTCPESVREQRVGLVQAGGEAGVLLGALPDGCCLAGSDTSGWYRGPQARHVMNHGQGLIFHRCEGLRPSNRRVKYFHPFTLKALEPIHVSIH